VTAVDILADAMHPGSLDPHSPFADGSRNRARRALDALPGLLRADTDAGKRLRDRLGLEWESVQWCACADAPASHQCIRDGHVLGLPRRRLVGRCEDALNDPDQESQ